MAVQQNFLVRCSGLVFALFCCAHLGQAQQPTPPPQAANYRLVFDDEFYTPDISPNGGGIYNWYQGVWFWHVQAPPANYVQTSGQTNLTWTLGQIYSETSMSTLSFNRQNYSAFRYGYFEVRMKWPPVTGAWPAIWMIPIQAAQGTAVYNGVAEGGELDIFEGQGSQPQLFLGTVHHFLGSQDTVNKNNAYTLPKGNDFSQFHTYGVLWVPGTVTWYYDNQPLMSAPTPAIMDVQNYFMVIGMQEGVNWQYGNLTGVTATQMTMTIDWVHVWQQ